MKFKKYLPYIIGAGIALAVGGLSGLLSMDGMKLYSEVITKPPLSPPGWLFPVAWTILYALMGIGSAMIWLSAEGVIAFCQGIQQAAVWLS